MRHVMMLSCCFGAAVIVACGSTRPPASADAAKQHDSGLRLAPATKTFELVRPTAAANAKREHTLEAMQAELARATAGLAKQTPPPYYVAYSVYEVEAASVSATDGLLETTNQTHQRTLDVDLRVGTPELDNTHGDYGASVVGQVLLPLEDDTLALRTPIWLATERAFRNASEQLIQVRAEKTVQAEEEDKSPDFSREKPTEHIGPKAVLTWQREPWEARIKQLSKKFLKYPEIETSSVRVDVLATTRYFVSSEGSLLQTGDVRAWVSFGAGITAEDGTPLHHDKQLFAYSAGALPSQPELEREVDQLIEELMALYRAPRGDPYVGPALLDGLAAAVMFHEVLGHRAEGHRLKADWEGKTFRKKIGKRVMPKGFDVFDDPLVGSINGNPLSGHYAFDDEGIGAERVSIIDDGVFRQFLMARTPIDGFPQSNGHGRKQPGHRAVSRQGNLVVEPEAVTDPASLKQALIAEVNKQQLPYGIRVSQVTGGETQTSGFDPQAFSVRPVLVYKVFPDGREELVRGVNLEGTPLSLLSHVVAAANDFSVFNGFCGAESGYVPVAATSPSLLISRLEVTRTPNGTDRPPLLPPPTVAGGRE